MAGFIDVFYATQIITDESQLKGKGGSALS